MGHKLKAGQITVMCPVVKARHWTFGDVNQLEQVFLNLFSNACDAMTGCATRELSVGVETVMRNGRGYLCCTVRDTGVGIPPEELDNVFRAFHTTKPRGQGKGLGLSISRAILAEHNGEITVGSVSGEGTSFMVYLPVYNQTQPVGRGPEKDD
ncbi:MAG: HAMP domain-containing sensor histidine kinase [Kiritimatiellia bacterium]|nr:HAMP domain-containing sensor histidine kinase [Kiritimatiellia bacterium]MDX9794442.1 HAMP domain-containing sensor histidine kinase [Kiritimatiellia bacterium]NLC83284.1 HAMP domain-containing histidine kinase [Lentisphaerota bacterium]